MTLRSPLAMQSPGLDRRRFIASALLAVGAASAVFPGWSSLEAATRGKVPFLTPARFAVLDAAAETIVPRTDTPGARDAGVPQRFDVLLTGWASARTQLDFVKVLDELDAAAKGLAAQPAAKQLEVVAAYDQAGMRNPAYLKFKALILALYYLSEPGATLELRYEHVPGAWEPSIPVTAETRAWAFDIGL